MLLEECYREIEQNKNVRENLSLIRGEIKAQEELAHFFLLAGDGKLLIKLLQEEDAKIRKNAALLLGDMGLKDAAEALWQAYDSENTLFVKSAYIMALGKLGIPEYLERYERRLSQLAAAEPKEEERKHVMEEMRSLERNITALCGIKTHTFTGFRESRRLILAVNRELREAVQEELSGKLQNPGTLHPLGVMVQTRDVGPFLGIRSCRELLFLLRPAEKRAGAGGVGGTPAQIAESLWNSDMPYALRESHREEEPFYFRLEIRGNCKPDEKGAFAKKLGARLEQISGRALINSTGGYEVEIRLVQMKNGDYMPFYKLSTLKSKRFDYRKHAIAASTHPATAAALMQLAKPYLRERAQVLDPFCGVGTMLIERDFCVPAGDMYGVDIFGDAIPMARENADAAGKKIHFINRDFFDFRHEYLFDEIVTDMPVRGKKTKEETDAFYGRFFERSKELLRKGAVLILFSGEEGFVKKQLRLRKEYRLLAEHCIREKTHFYLYIIQYQG